MWSCEHKCKYTYLKSVTRHSISTLINVCVATNRTAIAETMGRGGVFLSELVGETIKVTSADTLGTISVNSQLLLPTDCPPFLPGLLVFKRSNEAARYDA